MSATATDAPSLVGFIIACFSGEEPKQDNVGLLPVLAASAQDAISSVIASDPTLRIVGCMSEVQLKQQLALIDKLREKTAGH